MFENGTDLFSDVMRGRFSKPGEMTCSGIDNPHQHSKRRGLSASIGSQHPKNLSSLNFKVNIIDRFDPAEVFGEVGDG